MACCIGTGRPSFGHATKQAKVLYLIAEGVPGFSERIQSWEQYNGVSTKGLVTFLPVPIQFMKRRGRCRFAMLLNHYRYDLTFFDT